MMRCNIVNNGTDCYFFQECTPPGPESSQYCPGHCELSRWFISCIIWTIVALLCVLVACLRCASSPLRQCLVDRGCITSDDHKMPTGAGGGSRGGAGGVSRASSKIATFEDVVLVRSLSEHNK